MKNKFIEKLKEKLGFEKDDLDLRIEDIERQALKDGKMDEETRKEFMALVVARDKSRQDARVKAAKWGVVSSGIGAAAMLLRVIRITRFEDSDNIVTSRAQNEKL